jgi:hypothetical protein
MFSYGAQGRVETLTIPLEPAVAEIVFKRRRESSTAPSQP